MKEINLGKGSKILYKRKLVEENESKEMYKILLENEIEWEKREIKIYGKTFDQPRLISYMASDCELKYKYSGLKLEPKEFTPTVKKIKELVEKESGVSFNSCLLNLYRDGRDHVSWHSDNEKEYGNEPMIASFTLGAERDFILKEKLNNNNKVKIKLENGSLLIMTGKTQDDWLHQIPKRAGVNTGRINITFRKVIQ